MEFHFPLLINERASLSFFIGVVIYEFYNNSCFLKSKIFVFIDGLGILSVVYLICKYGVNAVLVYPSILFPIAIAPLLLLFLLNVSPKYKHLIKACNILGKISSDIYFTHFIVLQLINEYFSINSISSINVIFIYVACVIVAFIFGLSLKLLNKIVRIVNAP